MLVEEGLIFLVSNAKLLQEKVGELNELLHFLVTLSIERTRGTDRENNKHRTKEQYILDRILHHT